MKETASLKLGRLLQLVRSVESDLGIGSLSKAEKSLFTSMSTYEFTSGCYTFGIFWSY